ncbi:MAG: YqeG family HAD IIIA-type phosphatase [Firmicutes bacterium]|nr:YqeG family HAD IIIA-type phosphatase [Bacillota bacterium]
MIAVLRPRLYVQSIYDIDLDRLVDRGMRGLILDLDNTLIGWNQPDVPRELREWLNAVERRRFKTCVVSNNLRERVERFSREVGIMAIGRAGKPRRRAFRQAMQRMGTQRHNTAVIGDQVFTDILGGNRLHLYTILVRPLNDKEFWTTRLVRRLERAVLPNHDALDMGKM